MAVDLKSGTQHVDLSSRVQRTGAHYFAIGTYADIWKGELSPSYRFGRKKEVVLKILRGGPVGDIAFLDKMKKDLVREGSVWKTLKHPNILEFLGLVFNMSSIPAIVLPYYPSGNVMEYLKAKDTPLADRLPFIIGIANGIKYLHEHNPPIIHGDIRGANILIDKAGCPVIADCGLTFLIDTSTFTSARTIGVCRWTAPEIMDTPEEGDEGPPPYSLASDMFALAMTILEIYTDNPPFASKKNDSGVILALLRGDRPELPPYIKDHDMLLHVIHECWKQEPSDRPSGKEVCNMLNPAGSSMFGRFPLMGQWLHFWVHECMLKFLKILRSFWLWR